MPTQDEYQAIVNQLGFAAGKKLGEVHGQDLVMFQKLVAAYGIPLEDIPNDLKGCLRVFGQHLAKAGGDPQNLIAMGADVGKVYEIMSSYGGPQVTKFVEAMKLSCAAMEYDPELRGTGISIRTEERLRAEGEKFNRITMNISHETILFDLEMVRTLMENHIYLHPYRILSQQSE